MLKLEDFKQAKQRLESVLVNTGLIYSEVFSNENQNEVYIKPENLQRTGSFKIRGAYNKIAKMTKEQKEKGLIASSAGNHAQGVAYAAKVANVKATIVMPAHTPLIKVESTSSHGANVVLHGEVYDEAYAKACELQEKFGYTFVHPFDDEDVIEGQGTIALEILEELADTDIILVPIGGGGLISGVACVAKLINPNIKIIGVEPDGAASALEAMKEHQVVTLPSANTIADGTAVKRIGDTTYQYIERYVDEIITVSDYELMNTFLTLVEKHKLVAENSGLLTLAALSQLKEKNKKVVCVVSGGNIDVKNISSVINKGLVSRNRIFKFSIALADKPGELVKIANHLAKLNANIVSLEHNQLINLPSFQDLELRVTCETNGKTHVDKIIESFKNQGYDITILD